MSLKNLLFRACVLLLSLSLLSPRKAKSAFENEEDERSRFWEIRFRKKKKQISALQYTHLSFVCLLTSSSTTKMGPPAAAGGGFDTSQIWTSYGGWFADPKHWRRNTAVGFGIVFVASAYVFNVSRKMEQRPQQPHHRIPSQSWAPEGTFKK